MPATDDVTEEIVLEEVEAEWRDADEVGVEESRAAWAEAARTILKETARRYQSVISHKDLSAQVQDVTAIRTTQRTHYWIDDVLGRVAQASVAADEPILSALCVNAQGSVGDGYALAVGAATGETPEDGDAHAAKQRLDSYRLFQAIGLPGDGGRPQLTPKLASSRARVRKALMAERVIPICPNCQLALTANGTCDNCD